MIPNAEVSFILGDQRRRAWFLAPADQDLRVLETGLIEACNRVRREHSAGSSPSGLSDVGITRWQMPDVASVGGARDFTDFLHEAAGGALTPEMQALCRAADAVDRERLDRLADANFAHAADDHAHTCIMATFNWRTPDGADYGQENFFKALPRSQAVDTFMGQLANWLMRTGLGYDLNYGPTPPGPVHRSLADACSTLGEQLTETSDPDVDPVAAAWGNALQQLGDTLRARAGRKAKTRPR